LHKINNFKHNLRYWHHNKCVFYKQFLVVHFNVFRANSLTMVTMPKHVVVKELKNTLSLELCIFLVLPKLKCIKTYRMNAVKATKIWPVCCGYEFRINVLKWRTAIWGSANGWSWGEWSNIDDGEGYLMWRFVLFIGFWIILRWMAEGRSDVQYMMRIGCSWRLSWPPDLYGTRWD